MGVKTERQLLFEAVCEAFKYDYREVTSSMRGIINKVIKELEEVGATPEEVQLRWLVYRLRHETTADHATPMALGKFWAALKPRQDELPKLAMLRRLDDRN